MEAIQGDSMNPNWPAEPLKYELLEGQVLERALRQMIDTKAKQLFNKPQSFTVDDVKAFDAVCGWLEELDSGKQ